MSFRIVLDRQGQEFVQRMLDEKRYEHPSEVVLDALRLLEDEEKLRHLKRAELIAKIEEGLEDVRAERTVPAEEVFAELRRLIAAKRSQRDAAE
jgi:putative addiction module CopG family antidote